MTLAALLIGAAAGVAAHYFHQRYARRFDGLLERAEAEFRQLLIEAADPAMCFDGRSAVIVTEGRDYLDKSMSTVVRLNRFARNAHGEYFYFMSEGVGRPYFKHVEQRAAKAELGNKYVAPPGPRP